MAAAGPTDLDTRPDRQETARRIAREMIEAAHRSFDAAVWKRRQSWSRPPADASGDGSEQG